VSKKKDKTKRKPDIIKDKTKRKPEIIIVSKTNEKAINKSEKTKWGLMALAVTVLGVVFFTVPWIPSKSKYLLSIPLYAAFVYVYYRYLCLLRR